MRNPLTRKQQLALPLAAAGLSDAEIAASVGVVRQTVNQWRHADDEFSFALHQLQKEMLTRQADQLIGLTELALQTLRQNLQEQDARVRTQAALAVLKYSGIQNQSRHREITQEEKNEIFGKFLGAALDRVHREVGYPPYDKPGLTAGDEQQEDTDEY